MWRASNTTSSEDDDPNGPLERFLTAFGLGEYLPKFEEQKNRPGHTSNTDGKRFEKPQLATRPL
ncbi:hypothetical protein NQ314_021265 [Rhamnusium bicolor]|uniref:Uncharacterized protein n=1 Tax=Rhamnusium bicolor TaxID=1586634 RepID=A0AAV8WJD4_9CUCU|nr:hypothetical protein NQ314_021265 [Rhamnusium bicolor]